MSRPIATSSKTKWTSPESLIPIVLNSLVSQERSFQRNTYTWGTNKKRPILDCALIRFGTGSQASIGSGLYQEEGVSSVGIKGINFATTGMIVKSLAFELVFSYGRVIPPSIGMDSSYANYISALAMRQ